MGGMGWEEGLVCQEIDEWEWMRAIYVTLSWIQECHHGQMEGDRTQQDEDGREQQSQGMAE